MSKFDRTICPISSFSEASETKKSKSFLKFRSLVIQWTCKTINLCSKIKISFFPFLLESQPLNFKSLSFSLVFLTREEEISVSGELM